MVSETFRNYRSHILFFQRLALALISIQILVSVFHLFVPSVVANSEFLVMATAVPLGIVLIILGIIMAARVVDLEGERSTIFIRIISFGGLISQHLWGFNTIFSITIFTIAVIGEHIIIPKLEVIQRTQNYVTRDKLTPEITESITHADNYMEQEIKWIANTLIFLIGAAALSIFLLLMFNVLPALVESELFTRINQIIAMVALAFLFILIVWRGFPEIEPVKDEYDLNQN